MAMIVDWSPNFDFMKHDPGCRDIIYRKTKCSSYHIKVTVKKVQYSFYTRIQILYF